MNSKKNKILKKNLVTFLTIFENKPNILAEYLLEYDILDDKIIQLLINNKELSKKSKELKDKGEIEKPYFVSIEQMYEFYDKFFIWEKDDSIQSLPFLNAKRIDVDSESKVDIVISEMKKAIENENFELAVKLRDYCIVNNIDFKKLI